MRSSAFDRFVIGAALLLVSIPVIASRQHSTASAVTTADRVFYQRYSGSPASCPVGSQAFDYGCLGGANSFSQATLYSSRPDGTDEQPINLNCTGTNAEWLAPYNGVQKVVIDPVHEKLYWENDTEPGIVRSNLDGTTCELVADGDTSGITSIAIDSTGDHLYSIKDSTIRRVNVTTGVVDPLTLTGLAITPDNSYNDLTISGTTLYATLSNVSSASHIIAVTLDTSVTTQAATVLVTGEAVGMSSVSVDSVNGFIYWTVGGATRRAVLSNGSGATTVRTGSFDYVVAMPAEGRLLMGARGNTFAVTTNMGGGDVTTTGIKSATFPTVGAVTIVPVAQVVTWNPSTAITTTSATPPAATTSGDGAISYSVINAGATGCTVNSSTGHLQFVSDGSCTVRATAAATTYFLVGTQTVTFHVVLPVIPPPPPPTPELHLAFALDPGEPVAGADVAVSGAGLQPGSTATVELHSTPMVLGSVTVDGSGAFAGTVQLPENVPAGAHTIVVTGISSVGDPVSAEQPIVVDWGGTLVAPAGASAQGHHSITPYRVLDSRVGGMLLHAGDTIEIDGTANGAVALGATAVVANFTVTEPANAGFITVFRCATERPLASTLNFVAGQTVANMAIAALGDDGKICAYTSADTHLVVDISGYFSTVGDRFVGQTPVRLIDTRPSTRVHAGNTVQLQLPAGVVAGAAAINVIAIHSANDGFLTVYPCGSPVPNASNVNFVLGGISSAQAIAEVVDGAVCIYTSASLDMVVDLSGVFAADAGSALVALSPGRLLDTRDGVGPVTDLVMDLSVLPPSINAVALNVTATDSDAAGFVTVYPCGQPIPTASNLNFAANATVANQVTALLGDGRTLCVHTSRPVHLVVDVTGMYTTVA